MGEMDAYKDIFLSESAEFMQSITDGLLALESDPNDLEPVETVFRGAHSLKGMAAAMGYDRTSELTHRMESLMDRVRKRERKPDTQLTDLMLEAVDMVKSLIDDESEGKNGVDATGLLSRIEMMAEADKGAGSPDADEAGDTSASAPEKQMPTEESAPGAQHTVIVTLEETCVLKAVRAYMVIKRLSHMGIVIDTVPDTREIEDEKFDGELSVNVATEASDDEVAAACLGVTEVETAEVETRVAVQVPMTTDVKNEGNLQSRSRTTIPKLSETQTVRIAIGHLDNMVDLVGEIVILRARLESVAAEVENRELDESLESLSAVSAELQHEVLQTRMVPVGNIFNRFPRMVRDLARDLGKEIEFEMSGLDIELDRTVLDEIGDPIVHLLRNSADHGIESVKERKALGKLEKGNIRLDASRERDNVQITISDDGRGIDCERVWNKAVKMGLAEAAERDSYSDGQILIYTCVPGFSTSEKATKISGRGVGMDVVKGKTEHLGGTLQILSTPGKGSEFVLTLPLTLAIIQALLVSVQDQTFAIPLSVVEEITSSDEVAIDTIESAPVIVLRDGEIVPVFSLGKLLGLVEGPTPVPRDADNIVIVGSVGMRKALLVDKLQGRREVVIKPLSRMFRSVGGLGGATVLGDGRVALIIDPRTVFSDQEDNS